MGSIKVKLSSDTVKLKLIPLDNQYKTNISYVPAEVVEYLQNAQGIVEAARVEVAANTVITTDAADAASVSETNAKASEVASADSATESTTQATASGVSADEALASEQSALSYQNKSQEWAENVEDLEVEPGQYSSLHHSAKSQTSADASKVSEDAALVSENAAKASETASASSEAAAAVSETNAGNSETAALGSENKANQWAEELENTEVELGQYSALHHAAKADASKTAAAVSEANASSSETNAANSESAASLSESNAAASETAAGTSETNALASENKSDAWANEAENIEVEAGKFSGRHYAAKGDDSAMAAATSETNAGNSATAANTSETNAAASESAASLSETNAKTSETNASISETNASTSEANAATSETNAANSETAAGISETDAQTAEAGSVAAKNKSQLWAEEQTDVAVELGQYSSKHHSKKAEGHRIAASNSESNAAASESAAASSEAGAGASATDAATSEANALTHRDKAQDWAEQPEGSEVEVGAYSAKHWAKKSEASAAGGMSYRGSWDASTNTYPVSPQQGWLFKVSVTGTVDGVTYKANDSIIHNGGTATTSAGWDHVDNTESVTSVAGKVGAVSLVKADVGLGAARNVSSYSQTEADALLASKLNDTATAAAANKLATARSLGLGGDLSGSALFDGSANITINATVADDSHNHVIANVDGLQGALNGKLATDANAVSATKLDSIGTTFGGKYPMTVNVGGIIYSHTNITYEGATGILTAPKFSGDGSALTGTASLRATGTTKGDVGLGSVDNYSRAHYDGRYLAAGAKASDSNKLDNLNSTQFIRSDIDATATGNLSLTKTDGSALDVGTIRGKAVGTRTGDFIHMYDRVHIGSPNGWGSQDAPANGLSTYGGIDSGGQVWGKNGFKVSGSAYHGYNGVKAASDAEFNPGNGHLMLDSNGGNLYLNWHDTVGEIRLQGSQINTNSVLNVNAGVTGLAKADVGLGSVPNSNNLSSFVNGPSFVDAAGARSAVEAGNLSHIDGVNGHRIKFDTSASWIEITDQSNNRSDIVTQNVYVGDLAGGTWLGSLTAADIGALAAGSKAADSEKLDNLNSTQFVRSDSASATFTGLSSTVNDTPPIKLTNSSYNAELRLGGWSSSGSLTYGRVAVSNGNLHIDSKAGSNVYHNHYHDGDVYMVNGGGFVGIGTSSPTRKLDVNGDVGADSYEVKSSSGTESCTMQYNAASKSLEFNFA